MDTGQARLGQAQRGAHTQCPGHVRLAACRRYRRRKRAALAQFQQNAVRGCVRGEGHYADDVGVPEAAQHLARRPLA